MEDETETPQTDQTDERVIPTEVLVPASARTLRTAEGVGKMLGDTAEFIEDRTFARPGVLIGEGVAVSVMMTPNGSYSIMEKELEPFRNNPSFRRGTATMTSLDSFIAHVNRFGDEDSAVFANDDRASPSLLAVLDYHRADTLTSGGEDEPAASRVHGEYRHGLHRTAFAFPVSDQWTAWHKGNGTPMGMAEFAVFLEDNVLDVADVTKPPESAKRFVEMNGGEGKIADWSILNKLAKGLTIYENAVVTEAVNLASGEGVLTLASSHDTEIEPGVKITVPTMFFVEIPIFREGALYRLPVRLRYRKDRTGVTFWYELWRADRAFLDAFHEAIAKVDSETEATIFYGKPE